MIFALNTAIILIFQPYANLSNRIQTKIEVDWLKLGLNLVLI